MYTVEYFIQKFEAIEEKEWTIGKFYDGITNTHCVIGHCNSAEREAIYDIFGKHSTSTPVIINDGYNTNYQQSTPKQRILAALKDIKARIDFEKEQEVAVELVASCVPCIVAASI